MDSVAQAGPDYGKVIPSSDIEAGLRGLNRDINFDVAVRKPDEAAYVLEMDPARRRTIESGRLPVCHLNRYICSMDRGMVPEYKIWNEVSLPTEVEWWEADKENASIRYETIPICDPDYADLRSDADHGNDPNLQILEDGRLARVRCFAFKKSRGRVLRVGWRFTFYRLIQANIPNVTAKTVGLRFNVDMLKFPVGPPNEVHAALTEE